MDENSSFLDKVYDRYLDADYTYGDSNLNPKREITKVDISNADEEEAKILAAIQARLDEVKLATSKLSKFKSTEKVDNNDFTTNADGFGAGGGAVPDMTEAQAALDIQLGGDGNKSSGFIRIPTKVGPWKSTGTSPIEKEIDDMIFEIAIAYPSITLNDIGDFEPDCDGLDYNTIMSNNGSNGADDSDDTDATSDTDSSTSDSSSGSNSGSSSGDTSNADDGTGGDSGEASDLITEANMDAEDSAVTQAQNDLAACAAKELAILKVILIILKIIKMLRQTLVLLLSVLVPIVELITLAAQCWINPCAAAEAIQKVAEKVAALIITVVGKLIQMIWDSLQLDCLTTSAQSTLDEIEKVLTSATNALNEGKSTISFALNSTDSIASTLASVDWNQFANTSLKDQYNSLLNEMKEGGALESTLEKELFGTTDVASKDAMTLLKKSLPTSIASQLQSLVTSSKAIKDSANTLAKSATDNKDINSQLQKLNKTLDGFTAK